MVCSEDLLFARETAMAAGDVLMKYFESASCGKLGLEKKGPRDLVTLADRRAEELIVQRISERFPGDQILAEESGLRAAKARQTGPARLWIVDPLDGTTNFAHGHPFFAVSIARWDHGRPVIAVIHAPRLGDTFWAESGGGCWRNDRPAHVAEEAELADALLATGFSYGREELDGGGLELFAAMLRQARELRRGGSACLDLAHVATGIFAGFWEYHLQPHDVAAGILLIQEAGGRVTDCEGGDDALFGGSLVAAAPGLHRQLLQMVSTMGPSHPAHPHPGRPHAGYPSGNEAGRP